MHVSPVAKGETKAPKASAENAAPRQSKVGPQSSPAEHSLNPFKKPAGRSPAWDLTRIPAYTLENGTAAQAMSVAKPLAVQYKLVIGQTDDPYEREADQMADAIMAQTKAGADTSPPMFRPATLHMQRKCKDGEECGECEECKHKAVLRRKPLGTQQGNVAPPLVHNVLNSPGIPLAPSLRGFFESRFGQDFRDVRVHADSQAAESARGVSAKAYTVGRDVVFGGGFYAPETETGRRLIAHELTHVVQQSSTGQAERLQRDPVDTKVAANKGAADPDACFAGLKGSDVDHDGYWEELVPPRQGPGGLMYDVVALGKIGKDKSADAIYRRTVSAFVNDAYAGLDAAKKAQAIGTILSAQHIPYGEIHGDCPYWLWLHPSLMDHLHAVTGVEIRTKKAAAVAKDKQEKEAQQRARVEGGKQADAREKAAGLPPPPGDKKQGKNGAKARESGSEYTGPGKDFATTGALPATLTGPEMQPLHGTGTYRMELDHSFAGADLLSQVASHMTYVSYHWERFDITDLVLRGLSVESKNKLKQQAPSKSNEVGSMDATGRRAEYAYEDLKQQTESSVEDLRHPVASATTGSASEIASKAIANYENLTLLPASAIVAAGGWALGALADLFGGTFEEREIPWPDQPGYYMIRCIAQPESQGESHRAASVAVKTVELRNLEKLAKNALLTPQAELAEKRAALEIAKKKAPPDPIEIQRLTKELSDLELKTNGPATKVIQQKILDAEKDKVGATEYQKAKIDEEIKILKEQLTHAEEGAKGMNEAFRPQATLVSKVTGQTYPLLLQMGKVDHPEVHKFAYKLSDATSRDGKQFHGEGDTPQIAAWNAVKDFAHHNDYGLGVIGIAMPEGSAFQFPENHIENEPRDYAIAKQRLNDLVSVLMILGLLVPGVGEVALVLGAAMAAAHLIERWRSGTLRFDESTVGDIIGVLSAVFAGAAVIGKLAVVRTSESFLLKAVEVAGRAAETGNKLLNYGGMMWGTLKDLNDIMADNQAELEGRITHAEARRNRANKIASAVQTGALVFGSLKADLVGGHEAAGHEDSSAKPERKAGPHDEVTPTEKDHPTSKSDQTAKPEELAKPDAPKTHEGADHATGHTEKKPAPDVHDPNDPVAKSGTTHEHVDPHPEKNLPSAATFDGLHKLTVLEDGRIIRCSLTCGEIRGQYQEFLDSAMKDPERQKLAQELDARLKTIEQGAKSEKRSDREAAAQDAANLEPKLRDLAVKDLAAQTGASVQGIQNLSPNFSPESIRGLREALGKRFESFANKTKVPEQMSRLMAVSETDSHVRETGLNILKEGYGKLSDANLAKALGDLAKLQSEVPGHVSPDFLWQYEDALAKGNVSQAKKLLDAAEPTLRANRDAKRNADLAEALAPLEKQYAEQQATRQQITGKERELKSKIQEAQAAQAKAVAKMDAARTPEAREAARNEAIEARDRFEAAKAELEKQPSESEAAKDVARTRQAMEDVRLRLDPKSRAPIPCFSAETLVWTKLGTRRIDELHAGDLVLAYDFASQSVVERHVVQVLRNVTEHFYDICAGGATVRATGRHRFWIERANRWRAAADLLPGMLLHLIGDRVVAVEQSTRQSEPELTPSYNLSVDQNPNYFVGPGVLVHNESFDTKLGGNFTIYRGTNPKFPGKVYIGLTTEVSKSGKPTGTDVRQSGHRGDAKSAINKGNLSPKNAEFYEFTSGMVLEKLVTGLTTIEQARYIERKNIDIELGERNIVVNRLEESLSDAKMTEYAEIIRNDPKVKAAGFCRD